MLGGIRLVRLLIIVSIVKIVRIVRIVRINRIIRIEYWYKLGLFQELIYLLYFSCTTAHNTNKYTHILYTYIQIYYIN